MVGFLAGASPAAAKAGPILPNMTAILKEQHVESASVAVIRRGRVVSAKAWGMSRPRLRSDRLHVVQFSIGTRRMNQEGLKLA
jgi:hypothetical protein